MENILEMRADLLARVRRVQPTLVANVGFGESHGRLHEESIAALVEVGVPRLYLPTSLGGYAVDPVTCALVCEGLADADPSAAWHVMVYNAARIMGAAWPVAMTEALWADDPDRLVAASGHTPLKGVPVEGGFMVSGNNSFVSGVHHASHIMSPMIVEGRPYFVAVDAKYCRIIDNWNTLGMRGTGSNDVEITEAFVPTEFAAPSDNPQAARNTGYTDALYNCPSRVVFASYVPAALSLVRQALDFLRDLAQCKVPYATDKKLSQRSIAQVHFGKALATYRSARMYFLHTLEQVWEASQAGVEFGATERADLYLAGTHAMQVCATAMTHVVSAAGSTAFDEKLPLARHMRDMETLRHHGFANESRYASVAQVHWGVELDYPLLLR